MSEFVVWFDSSETGAPVLNNAAGSLISVLDACLVTGFNTKAITSVTVAAGVATATCAGHGFSGVSGKDVLIAGATPAALNGRKELTFVDTNTFRFLTTAATGTATGTITAKRDALGWAKQFSGINKAIYKRTDVTATSIMLRVLDTAVTPATTSDARVFMVETATDIDTFTGQGPTNAALAGGLYWNKGNDNVSAKQWALLGDSKGFYLWTQFGTVILPNANNLAAAHHFGDFQSLKQGDAYNCIVAGLTSPSSGNPSETIGLFGIGSPDLVGVVNSVVARSYSQLGAAVPFVVLRQYRSGVSSYAPSPSVIDSGFVLASGIPLLEGGATKAVRGYIPGLYDIYNSAPSSHYTVLSDVVGVGSKKILIMSMQVSGAGCQQGYDLTGPWRQ